MDFSGSSSCVCFVGDASNTKVTLTGLGDCALVKGDYAEVDAGGGDDVVILFGGIMGKVDGGDGDDKIKMLQEGEAVGSTFRYAEVEGGAGADVIDVKGSMVKAEGGAGPDEINVLPSGDQAFVHHALVWGGGGADALTATNVRQSSLWGGDGANEVTVTGGKNLNVFGGEGDDTFTLAMDEGELYALGGNDAAYVLGDYNSLFGGDGANDVLEIAGKENDVDDSWETVGAPGDFAPPTAAPVAPGSWVDAPKAYENTCYGRTADVAGTVSGVAVSQANDDFNEPNTNGMGFVTATHETLWFDSEVPGGIKVEFVNNDVNRRVVLNLFHDLVVTVQPGKVPEVRLGEWESCPSFYGCGGTEDTPPFFTCDVPAVSMGGVETAFGSTSPTVLTVEWSLEFINVDVTTPSSAGSFLFEQPPGSDGGPLGVGLARVEGTSAMTSEALAFSSVKYYGAADKPPAP
jgi:hypothetical protein